MSTRREARVCVMQALYARELAGGQPESHVYTIIEPELEDDPETLEFARRLFMTTVERADEVDTIIGKHTKNWDLHRITPVDRSLLRMATVELLAFEDIPPKVSVDEAIDIAKAYSTPRSGTFVNGVLDAILIDLEKQDRLQKSGRGLVGIEEVRRRADSS